MGRRTSPSSYEKQLSLIISPDVRRGLFILARNTVLQKQTLYGIDSAKIYMESKEEEWKYATC